MTTSSLFDKEVYELSHVVGSHAVSIRFDKENISHHVIFASTNPSQDAVAAIIEHAGKEFVSALPLNWKKYIKPETDSISINAKETEKLQVAFLDLNKVRDLYTVPKDFSLRKEGDLWEIDEKAIPVLCRRRLASETYFAFKYNSDFSHCPNDTEIDTAIQNALHLYEKYLSIPKGALTITRTASGQEYTLSISIKEKDKLIMSEQILELNGFLYPGNKEHISLLTADKRLTLKTNSNYFSNSKVPDMIADFGNYFQLRKNSEIVPAHKEDYAWKELVSFANSAKQIHSPNFPEFIPLHMTRKGIDGWTPKTEEFIALTKSYLRIDCE